MKPFEQEIAHIDFVTETKWQCTLDEYLDKIRNSTRPNIIASKVEEATWWPITTLKLDDPRMPFAWQMLHRPNSVHIISSIVTQGIEETHWKIFTLVWWEVFHYWAAKEVPNFPAWGVDDGELVEHAAIREMCKEEMPVLRPEWVKSAECLSKGLHNYNSVWGSTEQSFIVNLDAELPKGMKIEELDGHIWGLVSEWERIKSQVEELSLSIEDILCGNVDKLALYKVLHKKWFLS